MNISDTEKIIIKNDIRLSITLDYKEDDTIHTYAAVQIAPPFDNQLSPLEQETNVVSFLIDSNIKRPGNIDQDIICDIHNLVKKLLKQQNLATDANI